MSAAAHLPCWPAPKASDGSPTAAQLARTCTCDAAGTVFAKRAVLATLQYAFLAGMVDGAFALRPTEGFVGWLSFRVLQPRPFAALIDRVFAGIRRHSVDMVLRRCGFRMPRGRGFQHLHSGEEAVEFDQEQALRYATTARPVTEFF